MSLVRDVRDAFNAMPKLERIAFAICLGVAWTVGMATGIIEVKDRIDNQTSQDTDAVFIGSFDE